MMSKIHNQKMKKIKIYLRIRRREICRINRMNLLSQIHLRAHLLVNLLQLPLNLISDRFPNFQAILINKFILKLLGDLGIKML